MVNFFGSLSDWLLGSYGRFQSLFDGRPEVLAFFTVVFFGLLVAGAFFLVRKFYENLSSRDIFGLNLNQYNSSAHPGFGKMISVLLYFVEYAVIMPFIISVWFLVLAVIIFFAVVGSGANYVLLLTGATILAIRILAYYDGDVSKELAKLFPFFTLTLLLLNTNSFNLSYLFTQIKELPVLFSSVFVYFAAIFFVEIVLRSISIVKDFSKSEEDRVYGF